MAQQNIWEREYEEKRLVGGDKPTASFRAFCKWLKKDLKKNDKIISPGFAFQGMKVLDLGSGEGKNTLFIAERGAEVVGIEIAKNAIETAQGRADKMDRELRVAKGSIEYRWGSIGEKYDIDDESIDIVLDVTSTNSLTEAEREISLGEISRVLKPGGHLFMRALCKDSDSNAKNLIKEFPGDEKDTYKMPGIGLTERVFTESDLKEMYGAYFDILKLEKEFHYTRFEDRSYQRAFWIAYMQKK